MQNFDAHLCCCLYDKWTKKQTSKMGVALGQAAERKEEAGPCPQEFTLKA